MKPLLIDLSVNDSGSMLSAALTTADSPLVLHGKGSAVPPPPLEEMFGFALPIIGVLDGPLYGLWAEAFLSCDLIFAKPRAALVFTVGRFWPALLGLRVSGVSSRRLLFSHGRLSFSEMERSGWARRGGAREAVEWTNGKSVQAQRLLRPLLYREPGLSEAACLALERSTFGLAWAESDAREGARSFLEKRLPSFSP